MCRKHYLAQLLNKRLLNSFISFFIKIHVLRRDVSYINKPAGLCLILSQQIRMLEQFPNKSWDLGLQEHFDLGPSQKTICCVPLKEVISHHRIDETVFGCHYILLSSMYYIIIDKKGKNRCTILFEISIETQLFEHVVCLNKRLVLCVTFRVPALQTRLVASYIEANGSIYARTCVNLYLQVNLRSLDIRVSPKVSLQIHCIRLVQLYSAFGLFKNVNHGRAVVDISLLFSI